MTAAVSLRLWLAGRLDVVAGFMRHGLEEGRDLAQLRRRCQFSAELQKLALEKRLDRSNSLLRRGWISKRELAGEFEKAAAQQREDQVVGCQTPILQAYHDALLDMKSNASDPIEDFLAKYVNAPAQMRGADQ